MIDYPTEWKTLWLHRPTSLEKLWGIWPTSTGTGICKPGYRRDSRAISSYALIYVEEGSIRFIDHHGREYALSRNAMFCLIPGVLHKYYYHPNERAPRMSWVTFEGKNSLQMLNRIGFCMEAPYLTGWDHDRLIGQLQLMERVFAVEENSDRLSFVLTMIHWFDELLAQARQLGYEDAPDTSWLQISLAFMNTHYTNGIRISDVAKHAGMTRSHFTRLFSERMKQSPKAYLQKLRMEKAMQYLRETSFTLAEIASSISYPDAYSFSRAFHLYYGYPPSRVRER